MVELFVLKGRGKVSRVKVPAKDVKIRVMKNKRLQAYAEVDGVKHYRIVSKENADRIKKGLEPK